MNGRPRKISKLQKDSELHQRLIKEYQDYWLKFYGLKVGCPVVPRAKGTFVKHDPRQLDLWHTTRAFEGEVTGIVCYGRKAYLLVRVAGEKEAWAYEPTIWKSALDISDR